MIVFGAVLIVLFFNVAICGVAGAIVASGKARSEFEGFALGALLGPIGLVIVLRCPSGERVL